MYSCHSVAIMRGAMVFLKSMHGHIGIDGYEARLLLVGLLSFIV